MYYLWTVLSVLFIISLSESFIFYNMMYRSWALQIAFAQSKT